MATANIYNLTDTWTVGGTTYTAIKMNVTDTASAAGSLLFDLQVGGTPKLSVGKGGPLYVWNVYTDGSNYERGFVKWNSHVFEIGTEPAGTGSNRPVRIVSSAGIDFSAAGNVVWKFSTSGHFHPQDGADNSYDIGTQSLRARSLYVGGGVVGGTVTKTANYTATANDFTIRCDATSGAITITLPAAASHTGRLYRVKKIDASANAVTIDGNAAETIDGAATVSLATQYASYTLQCNGTNWDII